MTTYNVITINTDLPTVILIIIAILLYKLVPSRED